MFVYDYGICKCFLTNHGYLIFVLISFIINSPLQVLYHVVDIYDDHESSFVGANKQQ